MIKGVKMEKHGEKCNVIKYLQIILTKCNHMNHYKLGSDWKTGIK